ncbi:MAG: PAS domain-containing protein [Candidatus Heimdallarchaeota archaeon]
MKFIQLEDDESQLQKAVRLLKKNGYKSSIVEFESGIEKIVADRIKQLEENLEQLESSYTQLAKRIRGFFRMELPSGKLTLVDQFLSELSGYPIDEWTKRPNFIEKIIHPDFSSYYQENFQNLLKNQVPNLLEYKIIRADGEERWWLQFSIGAFNSEGKLISISAVLIDNTESKKREIKYSHLCESVTAGIFVVDQKTGQILEANRKIVETLGYSSIEELKQGKTAIDHYYNPSDREIILKLLMNKTTIVDHELPMKHKDGHPIWISLSAKYYPKEDYIEGIAIDISQRKIAERKLRESEELFRNLAEQSVAGVILIQDDKIVFANGVIAKHSGYSLEEILSLNANDFLKLVHQKDQSFFVEQLEKVELQGTTPEHYIRIVSKSAIVEVTKRVALEEKLREERDLAQKYFDIASVLLLVLDVNQNVVQINEHGCKILGYTKEAIIGKNWIDNFLPERIKTMVRTIFAKVLAGEITSEDYYENYILTSAGEERLISWHNTLLKNSEGKVEAIISSGEDITQWRLAEEILLDNDLNINKSLKK